MSAPLTVLVCGGRDFNDVRLLWRTLDQIDRKCGYGIRCVIDGASDDVTGPYVGADYWGNQWAAAHDRHTERYHADWKAQGNPAGPIRNQRMIDEGNPNLVVAFPGGRGTADMVGRARPQQTAQWTDAQLIEFATEFREGILDGTPSWMMCAAVCYPLVTLLGIHGVEAELVESDLGECNHVWMRLADGRVLDPTADQFNELFPDLAMPPVYLGAPTKLHPAALPRSRVPG